MYFNYDLDCVDHVCFHVCRNKECIVVFHVHVWLKHKRNQACYVSISFIECIILCLIGLTTWKIKKYISWKEKERNFLTFLANPLTPTLPNQPLTLEATLGKRSGRQNYKLCLSFALETKTMNTNEYKAIC